MNTIYVCLDDRNGLLFNKRRQSRDIRVLEDIRALLSGALYLAPYSEKLVQEAGLPYRIYDDPTLSPADYFAEGQPPAALLEAAQRLVLYRWNRHYPADTYWEIPPEALGFVRSETVEFPGKSHETITREVYLR